MSNSFENEVIITSANGDYIFTNVCLFLLSASNITPEDFTLFYIVSYQKEHLIKWCGDPKYHLDR